MQIDKFKVEEWFNEYEHKAVYDLADTCVESLSINELLKITGKTPDIFDRKLNYGDIFGSNRLKTTICSMYEKQNSENIIITHGAIGANQLVYLSLVERGDKVISVIPTYQQHYSIPKSIGANVKFLRLKEENNWLPDLDELEKLVGNDTKMICLNNPNNPTGAVIPDEMLYKIVEIARRCGAYILCDEVYRGLNHITFPSSAVFLNKKGSIRSRIMSVTDAGDEISFFSTSIADIYENGISTGSVSKVFSLAGLRLGWVACNSEIIEKISVQRQYNTISVGILDDYFASIAIENKDKIISRNIEQILKGKKILSDWISSEPHVHAVLPNGGTTAFIGYDLSVNSDELCKKLQQDTGVMILPGSTMEYDKYLRIGYGNNHETLKKGLEIFSQWLKNEPV